MAKKANPMPLDDDMVDDETATITSETSVKTTEASTEPNTEPQATPPARQGDQYRPYCRRHNVLMRAAKTAGGVTRYACPVPNCRETEKRAQPRSAIPRDPMPCPHCAARAHDEKRDAQAVYLEVDWSRSTYAMLMMVCPDPSCRFHVKVSRPDITTRSRVMRSRAERIGDR